MYEHATNEDECILFVAFPSLSLIPLKEHECIKALVLALCSTILVSLP